MTRRAVFGRRGPLSSPHRLTKTVRKTGRKRQRSFPGAACCQWSGSTPCQITKDNQWCCHIKKRLPSRRSDHSTSCQIQCFLFASIRSLSVVALGFYALSLDRWRRLDVFAVYLLSCAFAVYFPIQNSLKIRPRRSSVSCRPTTSPMASRAPRSSIEISSGNSLFAKPAFAASRSVIAFCRHA
jgi:hypothetical protein